MAEHVHSAACAHGAHGHDHAHHEHAHHEHHAGCNHDHGHAANAMAHVQGDEDGTQNGGAPRNLEEVATFLMSIAPPAVHYNQAGGRVKAGGASLEDIASRPSKADVEWFATQTMLPIAQAERKLREVYQGNVQNAISSLLSGELGPLFAMVPPFQASSPAQAGV
jgi:hypothetical protein